MSTLAFSLGPWEIILVLAVFLLLFGSTKLPKLARSLGSSMTEFKKGLRGDATDDDDDETKKVADGDEPAEAGDAAAEAGDAAAGKN